MRLSDGGDSLKTRGKGRAEESKVFLIRMRIDPTKRKTEKNSVIAPG